MSEQRTNNDNFYLGFDRHTGELVHVIPPGPPGEKTLKVDPNIVKRVSLRIEVDEHGKKIDAGAVLEQLKCFNAFAKNNALAPRLLTFVDHPGNSPCGGSCGGIPFSWC